MNDRIEFKETISTEEFCRLLELVGFQKLTKEQAKTVLSNTSFLVNAVCEGKSVGVVRVLTDMLTDAYITDVIVSPEFQGRGLGRKLLDQVVSRLKELSVNNVKLACSLYASFTLFTEKKHFMRNLASRNCQMTNMDMGCCLNCRKNERRRTINMNRRFG